MHETSAAILLVEDNPEHARLILESLRRSNRPPHVVHRAGSEEALAFLRPTPEQTIPRRPKLIILDLDLSHRKGWEALAEIKSDARLKRTPVVALTASASNDVVSLAYDMGANCCVAKPAEAEAFCAAVRGIEDYWLHTANLPRG